MSAPHAERSFEPALEPDSRDSAAADADRTAPAQPARSFDPGASRHTDTMTLPPATAPAARQPAPSSTPPRPRRRRRGPSDITPRPGRIHGLDGLRALAIIAVLVFHLTPAALPGGFLGVDVFFVISGFLITTLLLRELSEHGRLDLPRFWLRRARRLLPALAVVVVVSIAAARLVGSDLLVDIGRQALGAMTFSTNWLEINAGASYFHQTSPQLFINFWSLAVEEQFYLLWPLALAVLVALSPGLRSRVGIVVGIAVASAGAMALLYQPDTDATRVYYGTDTHVFALMVGVAVALAWADPSRAGLRSALWRRWRGTAVAGAFALLLGLMLVLDELNPWTFRGGILLACLATAVLLAGLLESGSVWRTLLQARPLTWLGERSYGIYLWHWPILMIAVTLVPFAPGSVTGWIVLSGALVTTLGLSAASYRFIETPVRRHGFTAALHAVRDWAMTPWERSRVPRLVAAGLAVLLAGVAVAVATAPDKSQTQLAIERSQAELDGAAAGTGDEPANAGSGEPARGGTTDSSPDGTDDSPAAGGTTGEKPATADEPAEADKPADSGTVTPPAGYTKDDDGLYVPDGKAITAIGDSLIVTSADGLEYRFPGIGFAAKSNRQWKDALGVLDAALAQGSVRDNVIVHFGTNAGVDEEKLRAFLDRLGPDRRVVVVNLYGSSTFTEPSNKIIDKVVADYPHAAVGDWQAAASAQPDTLQSDRVHPDIEGMHVYAEMVAEAFDELARRG